MTATTNAEAAPALADLVPAARSLGRHPLPLRAGGRPAPPRLAVNHALAERGANKLWALLHEEPYVPALGAMTGNQAMQQARAGLKAIYLSGWQVAADANTAGVMYPDQSL